MQTKFIDKITNEQKESALGPTMVLYMLNISKFLPSKIRKTLIPYYT